MNRNTLAIIASCILSLILIIGVVIGVTVFKGYMLQNETESMEPVEHEIKPITKIQYDVDSPIYKMNNIAYDPDIKVKVKVPDEVKTDNEVIDTATANLLQQFMNFYDYNKLEVEFYYIKKTDLYIEFSFEDAKANENYSCLCFDDNGKPALTAIHSPGR